MSLHPRLELLFCDFDRAGIGWCLLRLPTGAQTGTGDVDLLLDGRQMEPARRALAGQDFVQLPAWKPGLHFLSFDRSTNQWLWLHIVTELSFGPSSSLHSGAEAACLERRQRQGGAFELCPQDAFWELLLHCLVDKGRIAERHRVRLQELAGAAAASDSPLLAVIRAACPAGWSPQRIVELVEQEAWGALQDLAPILVENWPPALRDSRLGLAGKKISRRLVRWANLWPGRGLSVAVLGPDGAGKSTVIAGLEKTFILPIRPLYMGLTGGLLPWVDRLRLPILVIPGRLVVFWARYLRGWYHRLRGRLVVFDRYTYDSAVPTPYKLNGAGRLVRWIDGHSIPGPDLVILLDAPGEVMFQRKGEYDPKMLEDWRQHFLALQSRLQQAERVDTTRPAEAVLADATALIWERYARRWGAQQTQEDLDGRG